MSFFWPVFGSLDFQPAWYPSPQIYQMVLDFRPAIQLLDPGSANPCHIKLPTWMLEYAEDANAIHALTNGMELAI